MATKDQQTAFEFKIARQTLLEWNRSRSPIDRVLQTTLREHQVGAQQRGPISHAVYMMIRGWPFLVPYDFKPEIPDHMREFEETLREAFEMTTKRLVELHERAKPLWLKAPLDHLMKVHGVPTFLQPDVIPQMKNWHEYLHLSQFSEAPLTIRVNTLKTTPDELVELLRREVPGDVTFTPSPYLADCLRVSPRFPLHLGKAFSEGLFEVQDEHSQLVAPLLAPKEGQRILDLCAGAGGKTLHLAALLKGKSEIFAYDLIKNKRAELRQRAQRAGAGNIRVIDDLNIGKTEKFDIVLVDAPCSSLGTLRRNPDRLLHFRLEEARQLVSIQSDLLLKGLNFLKPGGKLLYATCTMRAAENTTLIDSVLSERGKKVTSLYPALKNAVKPGAYDDFLTALKASPAYRMLDAQQASTCLQLSPSLSQTSGGLIGDGFFMALIE